MTLVAPSDGAAPPVTSPDGVTEGDTCRDTSRGGDGVWWARGGIVGGGGVSIAANVAHSYIAPAGIDPETWDPPLAAVIGAACWPLALFLALEVLSSPLWRRGRWWWVLRIATSMPVAAVAAVVSYHHLSGLLASWNEDPFTVRFGPIAIDGLMGLCSALLFVARAGAYEPVDGHRMSPADAGSLQGEPVPMGTVSPGPEPADEPTLVPRLGVPDEPFDDHADEPTYGRWVNPPGSVPEPAPKRRRARAQAPAGGAQVECTCGLDKCAGRVSKSTRTRHRDEVAKALELAFRVGQNGHHDPASRG